MIQRCATDSGLVVLTFCQMGAVVVRLDEALRVVGVDVESVEMGAQALDWGEVLGRGVSFLSRVLMMSKLTWVMDAPVSSTLLFVVRGSPSTLGFCDDSIWTGDG